MNEDEILARVYAAAQAGPAHGLDPRSVGWLDTLIAKCERNRGVLSVFLTLLLKKIASPAQDIRRHQAGMDDGFSARGLDAKFVTPFLREHNFPHMVSGAGALTRSLEQAVPYDLNYPGKISPKDVRVAFLHAIDAVQSGACDAEAALHYMLHGLIAHRDRDANLKLVKPKNRPIATVMENITRHFEQSGKGGSRLPVLAVYAAYKQIVRQVDRYQGCELCALQSHTAADRRSGFLGDIQINNAIGKPMEVVEVKHGIKLTPTLALDCYDKFKTVPGVRTYYLLSTNESLDDIAEINAITARIHRDHGCQLIVNGVQQTLRYYLRLLGSIDEFVDDYVELVERECNYEIKMRWMRLWEE